MKRTLIISTAGLLVLALGGCVDREAQKQSKATEQVVNDPIKAVTVTQAKIESITDSVEITGDVTAGEDTTIGSKQNNRVVAVFVKDGDSVTSGQLLATMDDTSANAQLKQAQAQVATAVAAMSTAQSQVAQARRNALVGPHRSGVQIQLARAQVESSKQALEKVVNGARPEERRQAEANLASAKATLDLQRKQLDRIKKLVDEGAMAGQNLDQQQATYDQAAAQYKNAQESLKLLEIGSRKEDIDAAKANLQAAQENLRNAQDQKRLDPLLKDQVDSALAQVDSARAQLESARAQIQIASQTIADTKVYAPFSGKVSGKPIQAGTVAGANTAIVRIIGGGGIYFNGQITSANIDKVHSGDLVQIHIDGLGTKTFDGKIVGVNPLADSVGRLFSIRVQIVSSVDGLRPGMFAQGKVAIKTVPNAVVVPAAAILTKNDKKVVYIVDGNKAKETPVTVGLSKGDFTQVIGLPEGAQVVVGGQDALVDGSVVKVKAAAAAMNGKSTTEGEAKG